MIHRQPHATIVQHMSLLVRYIVTGVVFLLAISGAGMAAEGGWRGLLGMGEEEQIAEPSEYDDQLLLGDPTIESPATEEEDDTWMITSPLGHVSWPEIKMPRFEFSSPWKSEDGEQGWLAGSLAKARDTAHGAVQRTRTAWNSAIERMKFPLPGRSNDAATQVADGTEPGFWQRMLGPKDEPTETDDVVEMMAREPGTIQR